MAIENKVPGKDISDSDLIDKFPLAARKHPGHRSVIEAAGVLFGGKLIPVMAGPNTVENEEMIVKTAKAVKASGAHFLRGGAFKPLTFPYRGPKYFELREKGLELLAKARQEAGIPIITEVMHESRMSAVAEVADILQIGARNMQNYPLLEAAAATRKPIMLKRHFGCSLRDWLGAAEYILKGGNSRVILCERGVTAPHTHRATSRFVLDLQVVPAAQEMTHLPVMTDPSHATFWRHWVKPMSLASIGAGADGVMLEVHPDPDNAAVDPLQAIDFAAFDALMKDMERVARAVDRTVGIRL
ncbi:MAG TPA: 3-deoxy-7-phosphoheptulonate synthase [Methylomirabilota bacterium]|jgi:3-deoxy-7-phosphoheptulonate synthase|nr:3-deoxy-7-phosphoheptulonate synthase [Methylomirabilota bacterium]